MTSHSLLITVLGERMGCSKAYSSLLFILYDSFISILNWYYKWFTGSLKAILRNTKKISFRLMGKQTWKVRFNNYYYSIIHK